LQAASHAQHKAEVAARLKEEREEWRRYNLDDIQQRKEQRYVQLEQAAQVRALLAMIDNKPQLNMVTSQERQEEEQRFEQELQRRQLAERKLFAKNEVDMASLRERNLYQDQHLRDAVIRYDRDVKKAEAEKRRQRQLLVEAIQVTRVTKQTQHLEDAINIARQWSMVIEPDQVLPVSKYPVREWKLNDDADEVVFRKVSS